MRILLVEDNRDLGEAVEGRLKRSGHSVDWVRDGEAALAFARDASFDAIVLDLMLPERDGISVISALRSGGDDTPVLVVTARSEIDDRVSLLDMGADDYLVKPFDLRELEARLRALMRRPAGHATSRMVLGDLVMETAAHSITIAGVPVEIGRREFRLLEILLSRAGQVVAKERLMQQLFSIDEDVAVNALELYVSRLRRKIENSGVSILTVRGIGYLARADAEARPADAR